MTHAIFEFLRNAVVHHGYWALAVALLLENAGLPVPGETILLLASFLAFSEHELQLPWIIVVATLAATIGDNLGFALGHFGGRPLLARYQQFFRIQNQTIERGERLFERFGALTVFFARFIFGIRIIAGPLAGVLRMHWRKFVIFNFMGAAVWVTAIAGAGYRFDIGVAILAVLGAAFLWWRSRREN
jgi:membrane protein DedA with SNARE-associated domain